MRLYRRRKKNGTWVWWASWTENGVTIRRSTRNSDRTGAELVIARWERFRADPVHVAAQEADFGTEARLFLATCRAAVNREKMTPETLSMYRQKAGTLVRLLGPDTRLASFDGETFARYIEDRREDYASSTASDAEPEGKEITSSTLYKEWVTFRGILNHARRGRRFELDPSSLKPPHFGPEYRPRETHLSSTQADALLRQLDGDRRRVVAFVLATGARRREWERAQAGDVNERAARVVLRGTKTEGAARVIPIPEPMRRWLKIAGQPPFPAWPNARRALARATKRAKVPAVTWNDLRRTFASLLVQAGVPPHLVAKLLGHTTTAMVDKVYGRQTAESIAELIDRSLQPARRPSVNQRSNPKHSKGARRGTQSPKK